MKFHNVCPTTYHFKYVKGKTSIFFSTCHFHLKLWFQRQWLCLCTTYYLLHTMSHTVSQRRTEWEIEHSKVIYKAVSYRALGLEWTERPSGSKGSYSSFNQYTPVSPQHSFLKMIKQFISEQLFYNFLNWRLILTVGLSSRLLVLLSVTIQTDFLPSSLRMPFKISGDLLLIILKCSYRAVPCILTDFKSQFVLLSLLLNTWCLDIS